MTEQIMAFFNKEVIPLDKVLVPVNDRSFVFGDGVYEVLRVYQGTPFLLADHMARLSSSLSAVHIRGVDVNDIKSDVVKNIALNQVQEGMIYLQVSRGVAPRVHSFYNLDLKPNVLIYAKHFYEHPAAVDAEMGIFAITHEDLRWGACNIKSVNLLANCMAQSLAQKKGCSEAILIRENQVTEGSSSNIFLIKDGTFYTPPLSNHILPGTRRGFLIDALRKADETVVEQRISKEELFLADELFITSSIKEAAAIVRLDKKPIGSGIVSKKAKLARKLILDAIKK